MGRKLLLAAALALFAALFFLGRPLFHLYASLGTRNPPVPATAPGTADDAGRWSATEIDSLIAVPNDSLAALLAVQAGIRNASFTGRKISIGGARHSMGGQTLFNKALLLDMSGYRRLSIDTAAGILRAAAGARWSDVLAYLDPYGRSVHVMQGFANFTVGGSVSVNCHGSQPDHAPIAATVEALRMVLADGREIRCSRSENPELLSLALGGYGLFGVILDVELRLAENENYAVKRASMPSGLFAKRYAESITGDADVGLAEARLDVARSGFLDRALLTYHVRLPGAPPRLAKPDARLLKVERALYLGSSRSEYGKGLRWTWATRLEPWLAPGMVSRNQALSADAGVFANPEATSVDALQEYFIPKAKLADFLRELRSILPNHPRAEPMDVVIRAVAEDRVSFLRYAREDVFAVMLTLRVASGADGDESLAAAARELIDKALELGGTFYLPYRLHATPGQLAKAYPKLPAFAALKRKYDPSELFQNQFYANYAHAWAGTP